MKPHPAHWVVLAGVTAALHVGKLPPALPVLRDALGVSLLQAGFLLSLVQLAGMTFGVVLGAWTDSWGLRRSVMVGLCILAVASALGGLATGAAGLLTLRALEGLGFLLVVLPGPSLIRLLVAPQRINFTLGLWGAYMPLGAALALAVGPWVMGVTGWRAWWFLLAALSLLMAVVVGWGVPDDRLSRASGTEQASAGWLPRLRQTLGAPGPWLVAACFGMYSGQWIAVIGFLPTIYAEAGVAGGLAGALTALVAAVNMVGNLAAGRYLQRGVPASAMLFAGFATMGLSTVLAFAQWGSVHSGPTLQLLCVLVFSAVGGLIPGTLFSLAVQVAPSVQTVSTTVGWMQQLSALGQLCGPPLAAWVASRMGDWHSTWWVTLGCSSAGLWLVYVLQRVQQK